MKKHDYPKTRILNTLSDTMTDAEKAHFRKLVKQLDDVYWDTMAKQEALLDYIRARRNLEVLNQGYEVAARNAADFPEDDKHVATLNTWMGITGKVKTEIDRLRGLCGLTAKKDADLHKAKKAKKDPAEDEPDF